MASVKRPPRADRIEVYRDDRGEWRWRYVRTNGKTMADSGEAYRERRKAKAAAEYLYGHGLAWSEGEGRTLTARVVR